VSDEPVQENRATTRFCFLGLIVGFWSSDLLASYKVVLKDGRVLEARSKPVSMEGHYRFTDTNNQFQSISIQLVDLAATQSECEDEPKSTPARVLTNEDITTESRLHTGRVNTVGPASKPRRKNSSVAWTQERRSLLAGPGQADSRRDAKAWINKSKALNEKSSTGKGDGIKIGFETY
jgi:hypothetical protein